jgi:hypothetical protein
VISSFIEFTPFAWGGTGGNHGAVLREIAVGGWDCNPNAGAQGPKVVPFPTPACMSFSEFSGCSAANRASNALAGHCLQASHAWM